MNNVLPGFVDSLPATDARVGRIPAGRYAEVREVSDVIAFLLGGGATYVTGQNIRVDGGLAGSI
jgi:NAD(P)-dependent dehydrogenase (short-subunit alcohol dehydrogenase family)